MSFQPSSVNMQINDSTQQMKYDQLDGANIDKNYNKNNPGIFVLNRKIIVYRKIKIKWLSFC